MGKLPQGYIQPKTPGAYTKFETGTTKIRVLSDVVTGYEIWQSTDDGGRKPIRAVSLNDLPQPEGDDQPKHFWAMVVWNYRTDTSL